MTKRQAIFISYRREDSAGHAGRLYDRLSEHFQPQQIFMDVDSIEPGLDFVEAIESAVGSCDVLLAVIGKNWLGTADSLGRRRLDNPEDFVRLEITAALERNIRIIPVLVSGAAMPLSTELPPALAKLARRNAIELSDHRWRSDTGRLIKTLEGVLAAIAAAAPRPQETQTHSPAQTVAPLGSRRFGQHVELPIEVSEEERRYHQDARRFARLLASEIKLYNEQKVKDGFERGDLYERLREEIDHWRQTYDKRVHPSVPPRYDYFNHELIAVLAQGDTTKMGPDYPGDKKSK